MSRARTRFKGTRTPEGRVAPDGRWIVFARTGVDGENDVYLAAADGTRVHPVTDTPQADSGPDWGSRP